ncbi:aldehyde dehydrogenase family protein [soil metagenome]
MVSGHAATYAQLIDGQLIAAGPVIEVVNPADETIGGWAPDCSAAELDQAVAAARRAFPAWAGAAIEMRRKAIGEIVQAISEAVPELKRILSSEQGKSLADAEMELGAACWFLQGAATLSLPVIVNEDTPERISETRRVPVGVVGAIAPWNFPILLAAFKLGPALLAGNTVVLKPSNYTPLTTLRIGEIIKDLLPPGVLNIVSGGDGLGPLMTSHPGIDKIAFTGSTATGRRVMASASASLKRLTLELGGNDAAIVLPDVDIAATVEAVFWASMLNAGQVCLAAKRIYVHQDVYKPFLDAFTRYASQVPMGRASEEGVRLGPIQNRAQYLRVRSLIDDAKAQGHRVIEAGKVVDGPGYFVPVTVIDNPPDTARIVAEEQFGPVVPLMSFATVEEAIERANASDLGLGATVWCKDEALAQSIGARLQVGTVWINESNYLSPLAAFGGHKQSGLGVENGEEGLLAYTLAQTTVRKKVPA